ncbi:reverse transcriptase domain-containing protein [Tanacetum coccineum]|uniref:Reverse transcriptase domain-containing protein n=1 Tax=Tanacetum coccineum TaxID=301880 RepID=A0ABQ5D0K7_9ASTR
MVPNLMAPQELPCVYGEDFRGAIVSSFGISMSHSVFNYFLLFRRIRNLRSILGKSTSASVKTSYAIMLTKNLGISATGVAFGKSKPNLAVISARRKIQFGGASESGQELATHAWISKFAANEAAIFRTTIAFLVTPLVGASSNSAIVRYQPSYLWEVSTRFGGTCLLLSMLLSVTTELENEWRIALKLRTRGVGSMGRHPSCTWVYWGGKDGFMAHTNTPTEISATAEVPNNPRVEDIPEPSNARGDLTPGPKAWRLYTDGASNNEGSRAGLILIAPDDVENSYALRLNFSNSNNDAEYEALLAGLRIAKEMKVRDIHAFVDSKLVASQMEGSYETKGERMIKCQEKVLELASALNRFRITHIPRAENKKADALNKLAAVQFDHLSKEVLVEVLNERFIEAQEVNVVVEEEGPTWMTPIRDYLEKGM